MVATVDAYIRVSRVAGRAGESFISPEVQQQRIEAWASANGVEIAHWWHELDQSGAKRDRPMFQAALARCEAGETGGIVVAKLDRFARSAVDALESIKRLNEAGARLVSVEDGFDGSTPMGRFAIGILTLIAELELERIRENWASAVGGAIGRGVHVSARVPIGYRKLKDGRLALEPRAAAAVAEIFRRRALGVSYTDLAAYLEEQDVLPVTGNKHWSLTGVMSLLKNPVYLGQARSGSIVNNEAHEPIVSQAEFDAAQGGRTLLTTRDGSIASQAMLGGLVRCAGCGHTLKIAGSTDKKSGGRYPVYYCTGRYAKGLCPARATIRAQYLDEFVEKRVLSALEEEGGIFAQALAATEQADAAAAAVREAEHELDLFLSNPKLLTVLGEQKFMRGVEVRQAALDEARVTLAQLRSQTAITDELLDGGLLQAWPTLTLAEKRRLLHGLLDKVVLQRASGRGRAGTPIADRTKIMLRGNVPLDIN